MLLRLLFKPCSSEQGLKSVRAKSAVASRQSQLLKPGAASEYSVAWDTLRWQSNEEKPFKAKITYSHLILTAGNVA